jgi:DNA-binding IclR family transcriptional regulator
MLRPPIKSAERVLDVLGLFSEFRRPLRLHEISTALGYPQSSATVLLKSLMMLGYLNYNRAARTYFPSPKVAALGEWISHAIFDEGRLIEMLREIQTATGETVGLVTQNDLYVQYLRLIDSSHVLRFHAPESSMRQITESSPGIALLSRLHPRAIENMCRHINAQRPDPADKVDIATVLKLAKQAGQQGYAFLCGVPERNFATIAVLLPPEAHPTPLAVAVGGADQRITKHKRHIVDTLLGAIKAHEAHRPAAFDHPPPAEATGERLSTNCAPASAARLPLR